MATIERHVTRDLIALDSMTPCREAARLMSDRKVGSVAVREGGKIIGLVTERDLVSRVLARGDSGSMPGGEAVGAALPPRSSPGAIRERGRGGRRWGPPFPSSTRRRPRRSART